MSGLRRYERAATCFGLLLGLLIFTYVPAEAQVLYGSIVGNVTDPSGAVVPGAKVTATQVGTDRAIVATANGAGVYVLSDVPAGTYTVSITKAGFATFRSRDFSVVINTTVRVNAKLQVGKSTQVVTVAAQSAQLETDREDVHTDLTSTQL
ncbi:MAG: carboxypeptidase-like regulatory domain-containing protein, partial [Terriglobia bacterium]